MWLQWASRGAATAASNHSGWGCKAKEVGVEQCLPRPQIWAVLRACFKALLVHSTLELLQGAMHGCNHLPVQVEAGLVPCQKQAAPVLQQQHNLHGPAGPQTAPRWAGHSTPDPARPTQQQQTRQVGVGGGSTPLELLAALRCELRTAAKAKASVRACVVILQVSHPPVSNHRPRVLQHAAIRRRQLGLPGNCTSRLTPYMKPFFRIGRWPGCPRASNLGKTLRTACAGAPATPRCQASQQVPS